MCVCVCVCVCVCLGVLVGCFFFRFGHKYLWMSGLIYRHALPGQGRAAQQHHAPSCQGSGCSIGKICASICRGFQPKGVAKTCPGVGQVWQSGELIFFCEHMYVCVCVKKCTRTWFCACEILRLYGCMIITRIRRIFCFVPLTQKHLHALLIGGVYCAW